MWFGLWHLAPASVSAESDATQLAIGAVVLGFYLTFGEKGRVGGVGRRESHGHRIDHGLVKPDRSAIARDSLG